MEPYHKIPTVFKRDPATNYKTLLSGHFAWPEFYYLQDNTWCLFEKVDGVNIRIKFTGQSIIVAGRTDKDQLPSLIIDKMNEIFQPRINTFKSSFPQGVCLYGEGYGAKIRKGGNYRPDQGFVLFDVRIGKWWLQQKDIEDIASRLGIKNVPLLYTCSLREMAELARAGFDSTWGNFQAEGFVAKPYFELFTRSEKRIICKIKCKDFR